MDEEDEQQYHSASSDRDVDKDSEDGDEEDGGNDFALEVSTAPQFLKKTLDQYPEGTQILQEAFQNAVDAGASTFGCFLDQSSSSRSCCARSRAGLGGEPILTKNKDQDVVEQQDIKNGHSTEVMLEQENSNSSDDSDDSRSSTSKRKRRKQQAKI